MIFCKARSCNDVEDNKFIKFTLSASTYSIDDFNAKVKVAVLQEKQDWKPRQIKGLRLVILEQYRFMASNTFLITLAILDNYLENTSHIKSTLPPCSYKTSLDTSLPPPPPPPPPPHPPEHHYFCTINKSIKLRTRWMGHHQVCYPAYKFLTIRHPLPKYI